MDHRWYGARRASLLVLALALGALSLSTPSARAEEGGADARAFETPEALVEAVIAAAEANDDAALKSLVGSQYAGLIQPGGSAPI